MSAKDVAVITGAHGLGMSAAVITALAAAGVTVVHVEDESDRLTRCDAMLDRLDMLDMLVGARSHNGRPDAFMPGHLTRREIEFIDTPKPMTKRRARRLRARSAA